MPEILLYLINPILNLLTYFQEVYILSLTPEQKGKCQYYVKKASMIIQS